MNQTPISLYLHIPFCRHRCGYCDFNTYAGLDGLIPAYVSALCQEAIFLGEIAESRPVVKTIFFGGGTPSLLPIQELAKIIECLDTIFYLPPGVEITLEANPGTIFPDYLMELRKLGVNRLSLGMQSAHPEELRLLERQHDFIDVVRAVSWARRAGFSNLNLDLVFGLPFQDLDHWQRTLNLALDLNPEHFSLYSLTIEHGTPLANWSRRGLISEPDSDLAADMYDWSSNRLEKAGWKQYEISNWVYGDPVKNNSCQHNLQYWHNLPYLGLGAGAHGYAEGIRTANVLSPQAYIQRINHHHADGEFPRTAANQSILRIDKETEIAETMMMGLRLVDEGVPEITFFNRFGISMESYFQQPIDRLRDYGLLEWVGRENARSLRLTSRGRLLGNQVFMEFI